jgi:DNA-directed RNA polymerase specialized sigma24 family protein
MPSAESDSHQTKRLLERAGGGDLAAFDQLFELHRKSLKKLVSLQMDARLQTRLDPSDIVQETLFDNSLWRAPSGPSASAYRRAPCCARVS